MKQVILAAALLLAPTMAWAQQPQPNSQAEVAAFLARNLSQIAGENDALRAQLDAAKATAETAAVAAQKQVSDLQKQLDAAKAAKETPK